jgi:hypothetical protein
VSPGGSGDGGRVPDPRDPQRDGPEARSADGLPGPDHPHAFDDAAYVLGALAPADRAAYEAHVAACPECARSLAALTGVPGLLDRVPAAVAEALADDEAVSAPLPETLLPGVLERAERERRRRRRLLAVPAGVAAATLVVAAVVLGTRPDPPVAGPTAPEPSATAPATPDPPDDAGAMVVALEPVAATALDVSARITPVAWGTKIELECRYPAGDPRWPEAPMYSLVIHGTDGHVEQVAGWRAVPGRDVVVPAATGMPAAQIAGLEVRTADGEAVLRAEP